MRLWHKDLIQVLPRQQLLSQWRECCCIARNIRVNGTPNHLLVNKVLNYPKEHLCYYASLVHDELVRRGYKCDYLKFDIWLHVNSNHCTYDELFKDWHNEEYLMICYYNLYEKYLCGGISETEWQTLIHRKETL